MSTKPATKKSTATKKAAPKKDVAAPVEESKTEEVASTPAAPSAPTASKSTKKTAAVKKQRVRRVVNLETLNASFDALQKRLNDEITKLRESTEKVKGVKFLRSINKDLKTIRSDSARVMKIKPKSNRPRSTTSGFMKPVRISPEMAKFTGWDPAGRYSRVEVTKFICQYIKDNKLQNEKDRRQIVCNDTLKSLLQYSSDSSAPLTYFLLQKHIQLHFIKDPVEAAEDETVDVEESEE